MRPQKAANFFPSCDSYDLGNAVRKRFRLSTPPPSTSVASSSLVNRAPYPDPAELWNRRWGFPAQDWAPETSLNLNLELRCPPLLWVESPTWPSVSIGDVVGQRGDLLTHCFLCKKRIESDIYMFGNLRAFCSDECRRYQMTFEGVQLLDDIREETGSDRVDGRRADGRRADVPRRRVTRSRNSGRS